VLAPLAKISKTADMEKKGWYSDGPYKRRINF